MYTCSAKAINTLKNRKHEKVQAKFIGNRLKRL